jgi:hypothetical protein
MDGTAYFARAINCAHKIFMKSTNGGQNIDTHKTHTHTHGYVCVVHFINTYDWQTSMARLDGYFQFYIRL